MKKQLVMKDEDCEKLKGEIVSLRKEVDLLNNNFKSSQTLDDIISHQRSPLDKSGLGYVGEPSSKNDNASNNKDVRKLRRNDLPVPTKERVKMTLEDMLLQGDLQMVLRIQKEMNIIK